MRRRRLLLSLSVLVLLSLVAAACGSSSKQAGTDAAADLDPTGYVRIGRDLSTGAGISFDRAVPVVAVPAEYFFLVYDTLLRQRPDGSIQPGLAKSATVVDATTLKLELQPNVKFTDGTPMDADAVKFSIERNVKEGRPGNLEAELLQL